jgi:predicted PurR-regulated permease PerM
MVAALFLGGDCWRRSSWDAPSPGAELSHAAAARGRSRACAEMTSNLCLDVSESALWRVAVRSILLVTAIVLLALLARELRAVIVQFLVALLLAAAATPAVNALTRSERALGWRWRPGRGFAAFMVFLAAVVLLGLGAVAIVATVAPDTNQLATRLPTYARSLQVALDELVASNPELANRLSGALPSLQDLLGGAVELAGQASRLLSVATGLFSGLLYLLFSLILALYLTIDGERIRRYLIVLLPSDRQEQASLVTERIGVRLGAWARGEALLGLIIGSMTWLGATLLGLPYAAALALIAGFGELVPNLGPIIAAIPLIVVGLLVSPTHGLLALVLAVLIQQLEDHLIVPRVMSQAVDLHPVVVMVAILSGNELLGIPGGATGSPCCGVALGGRRRNPTRAPRTTSRDS